MKKMRNAVPILGIIALAALFFNLLGCKTCLSKQPYFALIGSGYFALLIALSLLFPSFPGPRVARGGLTWAILLALTLTYIAFPRWCVPCLTAHACHIFIWTLWLFVPAAEHALVSTVRERLCLLLFAPISVVALFSCLNLTFMTAGLKNQIPTISSLQAGDDLPAFAERKKGVIINFLLPDCPYCAQQLPVVSKIAAKRSEYRFINISTELSPELVKQAPEAEWVEDKNGKLRKLFKVGGYPTLFIARDGKISQVIAGMPDQLQESLAAGLDD